MTAKPIALVTGAAQGIGLACAEALLEQGAFVVLSDINAEGVEAAAQRLGPSADFAVCDMSDSSAISAMFDAVEEKHGPVSILVNNAGIAIPESFLETTEETFRKVIDINLIGVFLATQRAAKSMIAHKIRGSIVNMSSINAVLAIPTITSYCASKGGVMQLTKAASLALAPYNIRVNAVGPGSIDTDMMASVNASPEAVEEGHVAHPLATVGLAARDRRRCAVSRQPEGELHHRRNDLCRWRSARPELHLLGLTTRQFIRVWDSVMRSGAVPKSRRSARWGER